MLVSILIPVFNAAPFLETTLRSAAAARAEIGVDRAEIIVMDDGSSDGSVELARRFADRDRGGMIVLGDGVNRGGNATREQLRHRASGEFLQYLDADDGLLPGKLSGQIAIAVRTRCDLVYSTPICVDDDDPRWKKSGELRVASGEWRAALDAEVDTEISLAGRDVWIDFIRWGVFQTSSMLFRAGAIEAVGGWSIDQPRCQEHELILRILCGGGTAAMDSQSRTLYRTVLHSSVSRRNESATTATRMALTDRAIEHLDRHSAMTAARASAVAAARLETARKMFVADQVAAGDLFRKVGRVAGWTAAPSAALPWHYRAIAMMAGYPAAERVAAWRRRVPMQKIPTPEDTMPKKPTPKNPTPKNPTPESGSA